MKKNITITRKTSLEMLDKLGKEILNEMKQDFPLLRDVLIRTYGLVEIRVEFSFNFTYEYKKIIDYIEKKYNLKYRYIAFDTITNTYDFVFNL